MDDTMTKEETATVACEMNVGAQQGLGLGAIGGANRALTAEDVRREAEGYVRANALRMAIEARREGEDDEYTVKRAWMYLSFLLGETAPADA